MPQKNYRMAKRNREETRKKRKQEKLERKQQQRVADPPADGTLAPAAEPETQGTP
jgi:hypothetical protein